MSELKKKGFAAMTRERQREIASMGGKAVRADFRPFARVPGLAKAASLKSAQVQRAKRAARKS